jgi:hypothetical protein
MSVATTRKGAASGDGGKGGKQLARVNLLHNTPHTRGAPAAHPIQCHSCIPPLHRCTVSQHTCIAASRCTFRVANLVNEARRRRSERRRHTKKCFKRPLSRPLCSPADFNDLSNNVNSYPLSLSLAGGKMTVYLRFRPLIFKEKNTCIVVADNDKGTSSRCSAVCSIEGSECSLVWRRPVVCYFILTLFTSAHTNLTTS